MIINSKYLCTCLVVLCIPSHAGLVNTLTDGRQRVWVDTSSREGSGNTRKIMEMIDYRDEQILGVGIRYKSIIYQYQFDCKNKLFKVLMSVGFEKHQAKGRAVFRDDTPTPTWAGIKDGSAVYEALEIACK